MIYQVAIESITKQTSNAAQKEDVLVQPISVTAVDAQEAILKIGAHHAKAILDSKADYMKVTVKQF